MNFSKRILKSPLAQAALVRLAAAYLHLVYRTTRWMTVQPPSTTDLIAKGLPFIACFWHGRMVLMRAAIPPDASIHILISQHRDGVLISRAAAQLGVHTVTGSSKSGGAAALRTIQRLLDDGQCVAVTPDGPRGPRMRAKTGAIKAAQISGAAILPLSGAVSRRRIVGSWDRFCLALPFGRGVIFWGEPIHVPAKADDAELERLRLVLEERLNGLTAEADQHFGQPLVQPAAAQAPNKTPRHART